MKAANTLLLALVSLAASSFGFSEIHRARLTITRTTHDRLPFGAPAEEIEKILGAPIMTFAKKAPDYPLSRVYVLKALTGSDGRPATIEVAYDREQKSRVFEFRYAGEVGVKGDPRTKKYPSIPDSFVRFSLGYFPGDWVRVAPWIHVTSDHRLRAHVIAGVLSVWVVERRPP